MGMWCCCVVCVPLPLTQAGARLGLSQALRTDALLCVVCVPAIQSAILGESSNRFSLGLGSTGKSPSPHSTITVSARGIHDLAASPCGTRIAAAGCDGSLRIYDVPSGSMLGGCQSYYGAFLCCMFSPDGR